MCLIVIFKVVSLVFSKGGGVSYLEVNDHNNYMYELEDITLTTESTVLTSPLSPAFVSTCMYKLLEGTTLTMEYIVLRSTHKHIPSDVLSLCQ